MSTANKNNQFKVGDIVHLPLNEVGVIEAIEPGIMEFDYSCQIIIATISDLGGIGLYHEDDLAHVDKNSEVARKLISKAKSTIEYFDNQKSKSFESDPFFEIDLVHRRFNNTVDQIKFFKKETRRLDIIKKLLDKNKENFRMLNELLESRLPVETSNSIV